MEKDKLKYSDSRIQRIIGLSTAKRTLQVELKSEIRILSKRKIKHALDIIGKLIEKFHDEK